MVYNNVGGKMELDYLKNLYIAHRGIHNDKVIENTIPAFNLALEKKVPIEFDVRILKDGSLVVHHDDNLKRLMNIDRKISSYSYLELEKLTFPNTDIGIPLLEDVLSLVNGKVFLVIEIKKSESYNYKDYCKKIVSILENYSGDFIIKSFDIRIVNWFLKNTNYITGLLLTKLKKSLYDFLVNKNLTLSILKPDFLSVSYRIVDNEIIQNFRRKMPVLVWTIRNEEILNKVKDKADSFLIENFYF